LFIQVVLFQEGETLQLGVGLGEGQYRRVARCNRLDLGIGEFLAADVLGTAGGVVAGDDLAVMWSTTLFALCSVVAYVAGKGFSRKFPLILFHFTT
jgi:hypothetical protein